MKKFLLSFAIMCFVGSGVYASEDSGSGSSGSNTNTNTVNGTNTNTNNVTGTNTNTNSNVNSNRNTANATGGSVTGSGNSTNRNSNKATATGGSGGSSNVNVNNSTNTPSIASSAVAPNIFHSGGVDSCMGSSSAAVQGLSLGVALGSTWTDTHCVALRASVRLNELGLRKTAMARLCAIPEIADAFKLSGEFECVPEKK